MIQKTSILKKKLLRLLLPNRHVAISTSSIATELGVDTYKIYLLCRYYHEIGVLDTCSGWQEPVGWYSCNWRLACYEKMPRRNVNYFAPESTTPKTIIKKRRGDTNTMKKDWFNRDFANRFSKLPEDIQERMVTIKNENGMSAKEAFRIVYLDINGVK